MKQGQKLIRKNLQNDPPILLRPMLSVFSIPQRDKITASSESFLF